MTATEVTIRRLPNARDIPECMEHIADGLKTAMNDMENESGQLDPHYDAAEAAGKIEPDFLKHWARHADQAAEEIAPYVADLLTAAINRRLPWTWEPPEE